MFTLTDLIKVKGLIKTECVQMDNQPVRKHIMVYERQVTTTTDTWSVILLSFSVASNDELWIGLNDKSREGLFDWSDHSHVTFTSWKFGKPGVSTDDDDCVLITGEVGSSGFIASMLTINMLIAC